MIKMQTERVQDVREEVMPLLLAHWEEIALNKETVPLDIDWDAYKRIEDKGLYSATTARDNGKIIGYFAYFIVPNFHYKSLKVAEGDIFYLQQNYRNGLLGARLLAESEKNVKKLGVNKIINKVKHHFKNDNGLGVGVLFERMGYKTIETIHAKMV